MAILHPTRQILSIVPVHLKQFNCIGSKCSDTCCAGWTVDIDKKTFNAYRQITQPELKHRMKSKLHRSRQNKSDENYAKIELDSNTLSCPFIEENLCAVQRDLGEDLLSNTCFTYPRYSVNLGGVTQQALTLSCPEAARLALLTHDAFEFTQVELNIRTESITVFDAKYGFTADQMNEARFFAIQLLQAPSLVLWQKLAVLGVYCERLQELIHTKTTYMLSDVIAALEEVIASGLITQALEKLEPNYELQAVIFANIWKIKKGSNSHAQQRQMAFMLKGLGIDDETTEITHDQLTKKYQVGLEKLSEALQSAPKFLENYILSEIFREIFPFESASPVKQYLKLMTRYGVVRWMLAMRCQASNTTATPEDLVETVQVFCRRYQHNQDFSRTVNNAFEKTGWDNVEKIYRFLKS